MMRFGARQRARAGTSGLRCTTGLAGLFGLVLWLSPGPLDAASPASLTGAGDAPRFSGGALATTLKQAPLPRRKATPRPGLPALADRIAEQHGLRVELVHAVILAESLYDPKALSHKGAMGLMQLMPATARRYGVADPWDPAQNIDGGVRYLRDLLSQFEDLPLVLAAYNAGEKAVLRYDRRIPPFPETEVYVERALRFMEKLEAGASVAKLRQTGVGGTARLSGWGVIFGSFHDRTEARRVIRKNRAALGALANGTRTALVRRGREAGQQYSALLVGFKEGRAGQACKELWTQDIYCRAITPGELRDPKAIWR